jgi:hypothetical protein
MYGLNTDYILDTMSLLTRASRSARRAVAGVGTNSGSTIAPSLCLARRWASTVTAEAQQKVGIYVGNIE